MFTWQTRRLRAAKNFFLMRGSTTYPNLLHKTTSTAYGIYSETEIKGAKGAKKEAARDNYGNLVDDFFKKGYFQ